MMERARDIGAILIDIFTTRYARYTDDMLRLIAAALWLLASCSLPCLAEGLSDQDPALMTREQWQAHLKGLRERADVLRLQRRNFAPPPPPLQEELAEQ